MKNSTNSQVLILSIVAIVAIMAITTAIFSVSRLSILPTQANRVGEAGYTPPTNPGLGGHSGPHIGSCIWPPHARHVQGCTDSDGGKQRFFAGNTSSNVTANGFVFHDQCITSSDGKGYLVEYYCNISSGQVEYSLYPSGAPAESNQPRAGMICLNGAMTDRSGEPLPVCDSSNSYPSYQTDNVVCNNGGAILKTNMTTLTVDSTPSGAMVKIDDCSVNGDPSFAPAVTPLTVHMPPGTYTLHVAGTGTNWVDVNNLDLGVGETKSLTVDLTQVCSDTATMSNSYSTEKSTVTADGVSKTDECKDDKTLLDYKCTLGPEIRTETEHCKCNDGACAPFVPVNIDSIPEGADITIVNDRVLGRVYGQTPYTTLLAPSVEDDPPYVLILSKEGYDTYTESFNLTTEGATFNVRLYGKPQNQ